VPRFFAKDGGGGGASGDRVMGKKKKLPKGKGDGDENLQSGWSAETDRDAGPKNAD